VEEICDFVLFPISFPSFSGSLGFFSVMLLL
jgi:hypothetical protein